MSRWYPGKILKESFAGQAGSYSAVEGQKLPEIDRALLREAYKDEATAYDTYKRLAQHLRAHGFNEDAAALDAIASDEYSHHGQLTLILQKHGIPTITW